MEEKKEKKEIVGREEGGDRFEEVMAVMDEELLIRLRHRLKKEGKKWMVRLMDEEIRKREGGVG